MGNSFTFLFKEQERRKALAEFFAALRPGGTLIIDHRNYDAILAGKYHLLNNTSCYSGKNIRIEPEYVDEGLARFAYEFPDQSIFYLNMFPLRKAHVTILLKEAGFQSAEIFEDFKHNSQTETPGFYIHVVDKVSKEVDREHVIRWGMKNDQVDG
jgi:SAM-dependent methyltransferase